MLTDIVPRNRAGTPTKGRKQHQETLFVVQLMNFTRLRLDIYFSQTNSYITPGLPVPEQDQISGYDLLV